MIHHCNMHTRLPHGSWDQLPTSHSPPDTTQSQAIFISIPMAITTITTSSERNIYVDVVGEVGFDVTALRIDGMWQRILEIRPRLLITALIPIRQVAKHFMQPRAVLQWRKPDFNHSYSAEPG